MNVSIKEVTSRKDLLRFIKFPFKLYHRHPYWVPPLIQDEVNTLSKDKNPAFEFCDSRYWLAYSNGDIVGRIAAIYNRKAVEKWQKKQLRFGWFDTEDDLEISKALFEQVENWAVELGMEAIHGPLGFTDLDYEGMLVEGFDELGTMVTIYNYPYYPRHVEQLGYQKDVDWIEYQIKVPESLPPDIDRIVTAAKEKYGVKLLDLKRKKDILPYAKEIFQVLDKAYVELYGSTPLTERQVETYIKQYFSFINPDYVAVLLNKSGNVIGFGITMPSLSKALQKARGRLFPFGFIHLLKALRKNSKADLYLVGIIPQHQGKALNSLMISTVAKAFIRNGIRLVETNPELENNRQVQAQWKFFEKRQHKRRRCYLKPLTQ